MNRIKGTSLAHEHYVGGEIADTGREGALYVRECAYAGRVLRAGRFEARCRACRHQLWEELREKRQEATMAKKSKTTSKSTSSYGQSGAPTQGDRAVADAAAKLFAPGKRVSADDVIARGRKDAVAFCEEFPGETLDGSDWDCAAWDFVGRDLKLGNEEDARLWPVYRAALHAEVARLAAETREEQKETDRKREAVLDALPVLEKDAAWEALDTAGLLPLPEGENIAYYVENARARRAKEAK